MANASCHARFLKGGALNAASNAEGYGGKNNFENKELRQLRH